MFDFHEKRRIRSIVYSKLFIVGVLGLAILLGMSVYDRFVVEREMKEKLVERKKELEALEMRAQALEAKVEHFGDERGIEEELRSRFDVAKEGEQVIIIIDDEKKEEVTDAPQVDSDEATTSSGFFEMFKFW